ncbi:FUSC family protein [Photobacterium leiognathi]|uniref:FUSC family protein n=1 Tax=Photobacterium leiognathi TaxID=553611 RepID=UPI002735D5B0|nr:FUSC family protein [Photobacterium leiognathi]
MKKYSLRLIWSRWFSNAADIPDSIRITIPMVMSLGLFYFFGFTAAGISGLITAWLLGVQGRDLPYLKRLQILSLSTIFTAGSTYLAYSVYDNIWLSSLTLCSIAIVYGLMSNQRPHIRLFGYNFGFTYIMSIHFASADNPFLIILFANLFAALSVMFTSLMLWPFFKGRILQCHIQSVTTSLADWLDTLRLTDDESVLEDKRQHFYQCAHKVAYYSNSITSAKRTEQIRMELQRSLEVAEYIISLERILSFRLQETTRERLFSWIEQAAFELKHQQQITAVFDVNEHKNNQYIVDLLEQLKRCYNFSNFSPLDYSKNIYLFTSDTKSFLRNFKRALNIKSKEWRHGGKIALTLAITQFLTIFYKIPQGYWISLTAFIVLLTSSMGVTNHRMWHRFYGTALGGLYSFVCLYFAPHQHLIILTSISVFFAFTTYHKERYDIHVFWLTSMIVFAISLLSPDNTLITFYRIIDTLFGVTIAFSINYFIAPSWTMRWLDQYITRMMRSQILYVTVLDKPLFEQKLNLYKVQDNYYTLKNEIFNLLKEPNLSPRTSQDWRSLLIILRRLNDSLLLATKLGIYSQEDSQFSQKWIKQLSWIVKHFSQRYGQLTKPDVDHDFEHPTDMLCSLIENDIRQLEGWLFHQQAYVLK